MNKLYTKEDLQKAFEAGEDLVNKDWHDAEFCETDCSCYKNTIKYNDFESWLNIFKDI